MVTKGIGERLRKIRGEESLPHVAQLFGIHKNTLARYEKEESSPDAEFLGAFCKAYNVNPVWILFGEGPIAAQEFPEITSREHSELRASLADLLNKTFEESSEALGTQLAYDKLVAYVRGFYLPEEGELEEICRILDFDYERVQGRGRKPHPSEGEWPKKDRQDDQELMTEIIKTVEEVSEKLSVKLNARKRANMILYVYEDIHGYPGKRKDLERIVTRLCHIATGVFG